MTRELVACLIALHLGCTPSARAADGAIEITILQGEAVANNTRVRAPHDLIVRVTGPEGRPIQSAAVTFTVPSVGASGVFLDGSPSTTSITDGEGRAVAKGFRSNQTPGKFEVRVTASSNGTTAHAAITQFNMDVPASSVSAKKSGHGKLIVILVAIGGAAAGGIVAATQGGSSAPPSSAPPPAAIGITPGTGTVGPPQ